jgi:acetyl-CoA carboxylase biotin carboxyl carrier protein
MDLTNDDVADILALLDSLPYDSLDVETPRFRLTLRRAPGGGWTEESEELAEPAFISDAAATKANRANGTTEASRDGSTAQASQANGTTEASRGAGNGGNGGNAEASLGGGTAEADGLAIVAAPLPGTFYRAARPGADPFVQVGDLVSAETVIGIVETMKLMNSVPAGIPGRVSKICLENGDFASAGATLMLIEPVA